MIPMPTQVILPAHRNLSDPARVRSKARAQNSFTAPVPFRILSEPVAEDRAAQRQAELFYLQKQIHSQTPMVIVLEDGEHIEGCIEWYDRNAIKVRGRQKTLIYKSAIKYMYKVGENGPQGLVPSP
jgi:sRNA-binding regulator protein Hfq